LDALHARCIPQRLGALEQTGRVLEAAGGDAVVPLSIVVPLPVGAAAEAGLGEHLVVDFALPLELNLSFEDVDLARPVARHLVGQLLSPRREHLGVTSSRAPRLRATPARAAFAPGSLGQA